jgi:hypothetical protein
MITVGSPSNSQSRTGTGRCIIRASHRCRFAFRAVFLAKLLGSYFAADDINVTYVSGNMREMGQPHIGRRSGPLLWCCDAPSIVCVCQSTVVIVYAGGYQWWHTQPMVDLLSDALHAFKHRHLIPMPTYQGQRSVCRLWRA